jgi:two-component system, response regulator YesN
MYSLLIVDDEPLAQVGLKSMLDWGALEVSLVGVCPNGERAFEEIGRLKPDIVITDVRMPLLDGLGLIDRCRELMRDPPAFIVLSGYADFESARRSLRAQAVDFLVKLELDEAGLRSSVERAKLRVDQNRRALSSPSGNAAPGGARPGSLYRFLSGSYSGPGESARAFEEEGLSAAGKAGRCAAAYMQVLFPFPERLNEEDKERAYRCAKDMAVELAKREAEVLAEDCGALSFALALFFPDGEESASLKARALLDGAAEMVEKYFGIELSIGIGAAAGFEGLPESFKAARASAHPSGAERLRPDESGNDARAEETLKPHENNPIASGVRAYVDKNYLGKLALTDVAKVFRVSPNHLSTIFKKYSGVGFNEYVARVKIEKAKELLVSGGHKMFEVAQILGFEDAFYFSKVFKRVTGLSPREFCLRSQAGARDGTSGSGP